MKKCAIKTILSLLNRLEPKGRFMLKVEEHFMSNTRQIRSEIIVFFNAIRRHSSKPFLATNLLIDSLPHSEMLTQHPCTAISHGATSPAESRNMHPIEPRNESPAKPRCKFSSILLNYLTAA